MESHSNSVFPVEIEDIKKEPEPHSLDIKVELEEEEKPNAVKQLESSLRVKRENVLHSSYDIEDVHNYYIKEELGEEDPKNYSQTESLNEESMFHPDCIIESIEDNSIKIELEEEDPQNVLEPKSLLYLKQENDFRSSCDMENVNDNYIKEELEEEDPRNVLEMETSLSLKKDNLFRSSYNIENADNNFIKKIEYDDLQLQQCQYCQIHFPTKVELNFHLVLCGKINLKPTILKDDEQIEEFDSDSSNIEFIKCCLCDAFFPNKIQLHNHICGKVRTNAYICSICTRKFRTKSSLINHGKIHTYTPGRALIESTNNFMKTKYLDMSHTKYQSSTVKRKRVNCNLDV